MFSLSNISVIGSFRRFKQKSGHLNRNSAVKLPPMSSSRAPASCSVVTEQQHRIGSSLRFYLELRDPVSQDPSTNRRYRQFAQDHLELTADKQMQSAHSMSSLYCGFLFFVQRKRAVCAKRIRPSTQILTSFPANRQRLRRRKPFSTPAPYHPAQWSGTRPQWTSKAERHPANRP